MLLPLLHMVIRAGFDTSRLLQRCLLFFLFFQLKKKKKKMLKMFFQLICFILFIDLLMDY